MKMLRRWKALHKDGGVFHNLQVFAGLNLDFDEVRGRIIGRQPLPPIGEVFSKVHRDESRRSVMLGKKTIVVEIDNSALVTSTANAISRTSNIPKWTDEKKPYLV